MVYATPIITNADNENVLMMVIAQTGRNVMSLLEYVTMILLGKRITTYAVMVI